MNAYPLEEQSHGEQEPEQETLHKQKDPIEEWQQVDSQRFAALIRAEARFEGAGIETADRIF